MKDKPCLSPSLFISLGIMVLSFMLNFSLMSKGPYNVDCLFLTNQALETLRTGQLQWDVLPGYPLGVILATLFVLGGKLLGVTDPVLSVNFMSVVFSAVAVFVFYQIVKNLFNETAAIFSAVLLSVCPLYLALSVHGKTHIPAVFFLLLGLHELILYQRSGLQKHLLLSSIGLGCLGATREHDFLLALLPATFLYFFRDFSPQTKLRTLITSSACRRYAGWMAWAVLIALAFHLPYVIQDTRADYLRLYPLEWNAGVVDNFMGFFSPRLVASYHFILEILDPIGFILAVLALAVLVVKKNYGVFGFLLLWILVPLSYLGNMRMTVTPRYFLIFIPAFVILVGYFLAWLYTLSQRAKMLSVALFFFLILLWFGSIYSILKVRHDYAILPDFARWVGKVTEKNASIITTDESWFMRYYAHRTPIGRPKAPEETAGKEMLAYKQRLDLLLEQNIPVYITTVALYAYDWDGHFLKFITTNYDTVYIGTQLYEDWHRGPLILQLAICDLYRLEKKEITK